MGQAHLVPAVGGPLVDVERGGHGLQLVQLGALHGVYLLEVHQQVLGHGEEVVLGEALRIGLRGVVAAQAGRQQVLQEGALERALRTEEDEDFVVHHAVVQRGGQQAHQRSSRTRRPTCRGTPPFGPDGRCSRSCHPRAAACRGSGAGGGTWAQSRSAAACAGERGRRPAPRAAWRATESSPAHRSSAASGAPPPLSLRKVAPPAGG